MFDAGAHEAAGPGTALWWICTGDHKGQRRPSLLTPPAHVTFGSTGLSCLDGGGPVCSVPALLSPNPLHDGAHQF